MRMRWYRTANLGTAFSLLGAGCATTEAIPVHRPKQSQYFASKPKLEAAPASEIQQASAKVPVIEPEAKAPTPIPVPARIRPAYAALETLPVDLPTVIRLVDANSPSVGFARAKVREAQARVAGAEALWLPNLSVGVGYNRFDGQTQNQAGNVFAVSRANLFLSGGPILSVDFAEAVYRPLIERRQVSVEQFRERAANNGAELDAVGSYIDLVQVHALIEINAETLKKAEEMLVAAKNAKEAKLDRTAGDVNRAQMEVLFRKTERIELEGRAGTASARLGKQLLLPPNVKLVPAEIAVIPITLIDPNTPLDQLISLAIANRPDLIANREAIAAAWAKVRRQERGPLLPKLSIANQTGSFGGGLNDDLQNFYSRNALSAQIYWEVKNLGFGNRADTAERKALLDQVQYQNIEAQARASAEIVEAAQIAAAKYETLELAESAVKEATELYRISKDGTLNVVDPKNLYDSLRPLLAIQTINQARQNYLAAVLDFNRAQYRLFTQLGNPTGAAIPQLQPAASEFDK